MQIAIAIVGGLGTTVSFLGVVSSYYKWDRIWYAVSTAFAIAVMVLGLVK